MFRVVLLVLPVLVLISACCGGDEDREEIRQLVDAYQRDEVSENADELFKGAAVPGWTDE